MERWTLIWKSESWDETGIKAKKYYLTTLK